MPKELLLSEIVRDFTLYPRTDVSEEHVNMMVESLLAGCDLPPVVVCAKTMRLVDGFHRWEAHKRAGRETIKAILKEYASEADFFADAVRYNIGHGRPLSKFELRRIAVRAEELGLEREKVAELLRVRMPTLEELRRETAVVKVAVAREDEAETEAKAGGETPVMEIPIKRGLEALRGREITARQKRLIEHWGGMNCLFYVRQVAEFLEADVPITPKLAVELDRLYKLLEEKIEMLRSLAARAAEGAR